MELPGHLGVAMLVYAPVAAVAIRRGRPRRAWLGLAVVLALATSPDVDLYVAGVPHRGVTHSFLAAAVAGGVVALLACLVRPRGTGSRADAARFGAGVGGIAVLAHLLGDVITPMGIQPFLPVVDATYTLSLVYAADQAANVALLVGGATAFATATAMAGAPVAGGAGGIRERLDRSTGGLRRRLGSIGRP